MRLLRITLKNSIADSNLLHEIEGENGLHITSIFGFQCLVQQDRDGFFTVDPFMIKRYPDHFRPASAMDDYIEKINAKKIFKSKTTDTIHEGVFIGHDGSWLIEVSKEERKSQKQRKRKRYTHCVAIEFQAPSFHKIQELIGLTGLGYFSTPSDKWKQDGVFFTPTSEFAKTDRF